MHPETPRCDVSTDNGQGREGSRGCECFLLSRAYVRARVCEGGCIACIFALFWRKLSLSTINVNLSAIFHLIAPQGQPVTQPFASGNTGGLIFQHGRLRTHSREAENAMNHVGVRPPVCACVDVFGQATSAPTSELAKAFIKIILIRLAFFVKSI